jgi:hypothetical protein
MTAAGASLPVAAQKRRTVDGSVMKAMRRMSAPQSGQRSGSTSSMRANSNVQA